MGRSLFAFCQTDRAKGVVGMCIREARLGDAPGIAKVHIQSWGAAYRGLIPDSILEDLNLQERTLRWRNNLSRPNVWIFVAVQEESVVGFCSLAPARDEEEDSKTVAEVTSIYVDPDEWGKGFGKALSEASLQKARQCGFQEMVLWVLRENRRARDFYEHLGFQLDGAGNAKEFAPGLLIPQVRYRLELKD